CSSWSPVGRPAPVASRARSSQRLSPCSSCSSTPTRSSDSPEALTLRQIVRRARLSEVAVLERAFAGAVARGLLAAAAQQPAIRQQPFDADGPERVQLVGADADLRAQAVAIAVGEARARVVEDAGRVALGHEAIRRCLLGGDDRLGVLRA